MEKSSIRSGDSNSGINGQYGEGSFRKCVDDCVGRVVAPVVMNSNNYRIDHPLVRANLLLWAFVGRPCAYEDFDTTQVRGVPGGGFYQGQEFHPSCPGVRKAKQNYAGQSFGARGRFVSTVGRGETVIRE